jgi:hypothetical protein
MCLVIWHICEEKEKEKKRPLIRCRPSCTASISIPATLSDAWRYKAWVGVSQPVGGDARCVPVRIRNRIRKDFRMTEKKRDVKNYTTQSSSAGWSSFITLVGKIALQSLVTVLATLYSTVLSTCTASFTLTILPT